MNFGLCTWPLSLKLAGETLHDVLDAVAAASYIVGVAAQLPRFGPRVAWRPALMQTLIGAALGFHTHCHYICASADGAPVTKALIALTGLVAPLLSASKLAPQLTSGGCHVL